jgi:acetyl-CoA C-acetyltransferase
MVHPLVRTRDSAPHELENTVMTAQRSAVFYEPVRTAIGTFGGSLKDMTAPDLGAVAIKAAVARAGLQPEEVGTAMMGNVIQAGVKMNPARQAAIRAGLPVAVPAMTINRVCGSGAQAIVSAAQEILLGAVDVAVAGGMENMDLAPFLVARGRWGYRLGDGQLYDSVLRDGLNDAFSDEPSGWHTEDLVREFQIDRETQDQWALRSQQRFGAAQAAGKFKAEIVPVESSGRKGPTVFEADEHNRPGTTLDALAALKPAFREGGTITAGNAPGVNTGAAAMVLADEAWAERRGLAPVARLVSYGIAAVEPGMFGLGPIPAVKQALERAGWSLGMVERVEINEAFAAIAIAVTRELGLPQDIVNIEGGAIAHGHPIGATGAVLMTRLLHSMRRDGLKRGVVTLCIGGGQGIALALETIAQRRGWTRPGRPLLASHRQTRWARTRSGVIEITLAPRRSSGITEGEWS